MSRKLPKRKHDLLKVPSVSINQPLKLEERLKDRDTLVLSQKDKRNFIMGLVFAIFVWVVVFLILVVYFYISPKG